VKGIHTRDIKDFLEAFYKEAKFRDEVGLILGNGEKSQIKRIRDKLKGWGVKSVQ
jgi:transposase-like protein